MEQEKEKKAGGLPPEDFPEEVPEPPPEPGEVKEEPPEELIRALESAEGEAEEEAPSPGRWKHLSPILLGVGIFGCLLGLVLGVYTLKRLLHPAGGKAQPVKSSIPAESPAQGPLGSLPLPGRTEHALVLKHFLIPLQTEGGAPVFIKASVVLYFTTQKEVLRARKLENPLRTIIYETFKNIPFYYWRSPEGVKKIRAALLKALRERAPENLVPVSVEVTGYILK